MATTQLAVPAGPLPGSMDVTLRMNHDHTTTSANELAIEYSSSNSPNVKVNEVNEVDSHPLTEFHFFPKLPIELRLKIWKNALPGPRYIEFDNGGYFAPIFDTESRSFAQPWQIRCDEVAPSLFFTTREARSVVLEKYSPIIGTLKGSKAVIAALILMSSSLRNTTFHFGLDLSATK